MAESFADVWRRARLALPSAPALLVRDWAQDAFTRACEYRHWGFLRVEGLISTLASRSVTVGVTQGSTTVTSTAAFVATDVGRQIRIGNLPVYTITVRTDASTVTIDQAYGGDNDTDASATILDAYITMPANFRRFLIVLDPYSQRTIPFDGQQDQLGWADPGRTNTDSGPRGLVARTPSPVPATLGQIRYELHPYPTAARQYPYLYLKAAPRFADTDALTGVFANRADLLKLGTQMQAAEWPGTVDQKNPYFNLGLAERLTARYNLELQRLALADDAQYPDDWMPIHWARLYSWLTRDDHYLRASDATVGDYY